MNERSLFLLSLHAQQINQQQNLLPNKKNKKIQHVHYLHSQIWPYRLSLTPHWPVGLSDWSAVFEWGMVYHHHVFCEMSAMLVDTTSDRPSCQVQNEINNRTNCWDTVLWTSHLAGKWTFEIKLMFLMG